jgi:hypothetical protein
MRVSFVLLAALALVPGCTVEESPSDTGGSGDAPGPRDVPGLDAPRETRVFIGEGAPADAPMRFGGAVDPSFTPELVYPPDAVAVPPNLGELEIHYRTGGATLFELAASTPTVELRVYFGCPEAAPGGCIYTPARDVWEAFATAAAGRGPITYSLRGTDDTGRVSATASRSIRVTGEPITGGLYYWHASRGTIERFEFGVRGAVAETYLDRARAGAGMCIGCHALSRDGTRMTVGTDTPTEVMQMYDVASRTRLWQTGMRGLFPPSPTEPNFVSLNADGSLVVGSSLMGLTFRDGATGAITAGPVGAGPSEMPDVSPDGMHVVYVSVPPGPTFPGLYDLSSVVSGTIRRMDFDGTAWADSGTALVEAGTGNNYYPTYSPDGAFIVFNRSPSNTPSMGMDASSAMTAYVPDAQLWVVPAGGGAPVQLLRANGFADAWPKFDPTMYVSEGRPLYWLAWSSRRAFGLRYDESGPHAPQLWMAAFDPTEAAAGNDPAFPAFRLPFQDVDTGNHIAQWVTSVERMTCTTDADCGGEFCVDGRCFEEIPLM